MRLHQMLSGFVENQTDWEFVSLNVPTKLKIIEDHNDLVIITNQRGISKEGFFILIIINILFYSELRGI